jgi:hypothetical protein
MERADRAQDALNQANGLPEVTATVRRERKEEANAAQDEVKKHQEELSELFAETLGTMHDVEGLELPDALKADADRMIAISKKA